MVSRVDVIGLNPTKSFFTPIDLIPFLGGGIKIYKGGRIVYQGGRQIARGSLAAATGKVRVKGGQIVAGGSARLTGAVAAVQGAKHARKGIPDVAVGAASVYLDYLATKQLLRMGRGNKGQPRTETQRIKSSRNVGKRKTQKTLPRRNGRCPNGYRYNAKLNACVRK